MERPRDLARALVRQAGNLKFRRAASRFARGLPRSSGRPITLEPTALTEYFRGNTEGSGIMKPLSYFEVYHRHLAKFIGRPVNVVEIGVYSGGSIGMWRSYFGPDCHMYGIDIEEECRRHQGEGVDIFIGDQSDPVFWEAFKRQVPQVDVVLDDGGHLTHQQVPTLEALLPHMSNGGVYICEDVGSLYNGFQAYVEGMSGYLHETGGPATGFQQAVHSIHLYPFIVVIEKPLSPISVFTDEAHGTEWATYAPVAYGQTRPT
jgi:Methyltransferase domain